MIFLPILRILLLHLSQNEKKGAINTFLFIHKPEKKR